MALNTSKCNLLTTLHFKGLNSKFGDLVLATQLTYYLVNIYSKIQTRIFRKHQIFMIFSI